MSSLTIYRNIPSFNGFGTEGFQAQKKNEKKEDNAGNQHFSISHNVFYPFKDKTLLFEPYLLYLQN